MGEGESGKFMLLRPGGYGKIVEKPLIKGAMILKFQGANRVGYLFKGVGLPMSKIISRIYMPSTTSPRMTMLHYSVNDWITHIDVARSHIYLGTENVFSFLAFA